MEGFCLRGELDSDITMTSRKSTRRRDEDASSVFDMGVQLFPLAKHTVEMIKITLSTNKVSVQMSFPQRGLL